MRSASPSAARLLLALLLATLSASANVCAADEPRLKPVTVASGLEHPWAAAFLPDGRIVVTERLGRMRVIAKDGGLGEPLAGVPAVAASGQGGLLDVVAGPAFERDPWLYFSFSEPGEGGNGTAVAKARLAGEAGRERLADVRVLFRQQPKVDSRLHFGSRLAFAPDGMLFVTLGERFSRKDDAQKLDNHLGKIVRIAPDGSVPKDNPFVGQSGAKPQIWSYGHRNPQGLAIHPRTGALWEIEHGPQGGDELNLVQRGRNHGWPVITYGRNYGSGTPIGDGTERADVVAPLRWWVPISIAPSGMAFLTSDRYPGWQGSLFIGALAARRLVRLSLEGDKVTGEQRLLDDLDQRIRDVRQGPDGWLYVLTDEADGKLIRLER